MAGRKRTYAAAVPGRNRYAQKCHGCGVMCGPGEGYLKKKKAESGYYVYHEQCKPGKVTTTIVAEDESQFLGSELLRTLEARLADRQLKGEPIILLPKIIDHIKDLEMKVAKYEG